MFVSMNARLATLTVLAKMALSDGKVTAEERAFLEELVDETETVDELLERSRNRPLADLLEPLENYADRFFVAMRAANMARLDANLDAREEALYDELVEVLAITVDDRALITRTVESLHADPPSPVEPRVEELFCQSSFVDLVG